MKLHELLRAGIDALKEFEQRDNCFVDMAKWTEPSQSGFGAPCFACLGGAYYIKSTGIDIQDSQLDTFKRSITDEERILDNLRLGCVDMALYVKSADFLLNLPEIGLDRAIADYHEDRDQFYEDLETLYTDLKNEDL